MARKQPRRRCTAKTASRTPCRVAALKGQRRCYDHAKGAAIKAKRASARSRGGKALRVTPAKKPADLSTIEAVRGHLEQELANIQQLPVTTRRAATVARICREAAVLIDMVEYRGRLERLEAALGL